MPFSRPHRVRRCVTLSVFACLSCSAITSTMAAESHRAGPRHTSRTATSPSKPLPAPPTPAANATPDPSRDVELPDSVLLKGLPSSWRATILDDPQSPAATPSSGATTGKNGMKEAPRVPSTNTLQPGGADSQPGVASTNRILLPVPPRMGIAAFQSGDRFIIVIDNAEPMDTSALRGDGIFSTLSVNTLPDATLIQVRLPDTRRLYLSQQAEGWVLGDKPPPGGDYDDRRVINPQYTDSGVLYPMRRSGRVLSISDPASGDRLLVGTSAMDDGGILSLRNGDGYDVWPTTEGIVIAAHSPRIDLKPVPNGILLTEDGKAFPDHGRAIYANDVDLKWLGLQNLPVDALIQRYRTSLLAAADSDPFHRFTRRLDAAKAAFNLGAFVEARGILTVALQDDPEEAALPDVRFLLAASELLCGTMDGALMLNGPWPSSQKRATQLWQGLYLAAIGENDATAAHQLALDFGRLKSYPAPIRDALLPAAAEEIGRYGTPEDLAVLDDLPPGSRYQLANAFRQMRSGKRDLAYASFQKLADDPNPQVAEKALEQKTSIELADGRIKPDAAAEIFNTMMPDARLAGREATVRLMQADAYMQTHNWSDALQAIDAARTYPDMASKNMMAPLVSQALAGLADSSSPGSDKKSLLHDTAMLKVHLPDLPPGAQKGNVLVSYGRMLLALGLPDDAAQAFSDAIPMLTAPDLRAKAGAALAETDIERKLPQDAAQALAITDNPSLPDDIRTTRQVIAARVALATGDQAKALSLLHNSPNASALDLTARIHEEKGEWAAAAGDIRKMAEDIIPPTGPLTESQQILALRLASDASQASDQRLLGWVADRVGDRISDGDRGRMFKLLTKPSGAALTASQTSAPL
ncbi:hypothetical protein HLH36_05060 [Gluconacetobacter aggeris]|uniref:Tetratricopeptide repeat protein n=1 Tax=Gluconacetobacter aggeris TaxID=1286186 RepID=A0A7W4NXP0_9PROT|nr:hypothetical protein [Gluconacetobacter aggeris]